MSNDIYNIVKLYDELIDFPAYLSVVMPELKIKDESEFKIPCPLHEDTDPSFAYSKKRGIWTCFGACHMSGKMVAFHHKLMKNRYGENNVTMIDTLRELHDLFPSILPEVNLTKKRNRSDDSINILKSLTNKSDRREKRKLIPRNIDINDFILLEFLREGKGGEFRE